MILDVSNYPDRDNEEDRKKQSAEVEFKTEILDKPEQIIKQITHLAESPSGLSIVSVSGEMQLVYNNFLDLHKNILDNYKMGIGKGIRWIISIDKDNIDLVKKFHGPAVTNYITFCIAAFSPVLHILPVDA